MNEFALPQPPKAQSQIKGSKLHTTVKDDAVHLDQPEQINRPLYQIADDYTALVDYLIEVGGEMTPETIAMWEDIQGETGAKLEACAMFIRNMESHRDAVKAEAKRLSDRAKAAENKARATRDMTEFQMDRLKITKSIGTTATLQIQAKPAKCDIFDESQVPAEFTTVSVTMPGEDWERLQQVISSRDGWKLETAVDKKAVIKAWNDCAGGEQVPGTVVSKGTTLVIR